MSLKSSFDPKIWSSKRIK